MSSTTSTFIPTLDRERLDALAIELSVPPAAVAAAAIAVILYRYEAQPCLIVAAPSADDSVRFDLSCSLELTFIGLIQAAATQLQGISVTTIPVEIRSAEPACVAAESASAVEPVFIRITEARRSTASVDPQLQSQWEVLLNRLLRHPETTLKDAFAAQDAPSGRPVSSGADNAVEREVAKVWREVLRVDELDFHANLFDLGCDSLRTIQAVSRLEAQFGVELSVADVIAAPSVAAIAAYVAAPARERSASSERAFLPHKLADAVSRPVSFAQARMWLGEQLAPGTSLFLIPVRWDIRGPLVVSVLERAISEIVRRHEILRTVYISEDGIPVQHVCEAVPVTVPVIDLTGVDPAERGSTVHLLGNQEARRPMDLSRGPLLRAALLRLSPEEHVLLLTIHHIASDGWSMGIFCREFSLLYQAFLAGSASPLQELPLQYSDYAAWQRQWLTGEVLDRQLSYWKEQLERAPATLDMPFDYSRPAKSTYVGAVESHALPRALVEKLERLSHQHNSTLYISLLAAYHTLLHRYTGASDVCVGSPMANRTRVETESLIGCFINTLVLRARFEEDLSFRGLLAQVRDTALGAMAHQEIPFDQLVQEIDPERIPGVTPFFQTMFILQNVGSEETIRDIPGLEINIADRDTGAAEFDSVLSVDPTESGDWQVSLRYDVALFTSETARQLIEDYVELLADIAAAPDKRVSELRLASALPPERHALQQPTVAQIATGSIISWFEQQAHACPDSVAVSAESGSLTYAELNRRATQLGGFLQSRGVRAGSAVAIFMERSASLVVAILGVLKAGAAYVPVDPSYPKIRVRYMLTDCSAPIVLTHRRLLPDLVEHARDTICIDDDDYTELDRQEYTCDPSRIAADNPAYIIYTSGSTGNPKGVVIPHRALFNHMAWMMAEFAISSADRVIQKTPISFDASVWEFFAPLLCGGALIVAKAGSHGDTTYLSELIARERVTILQVVPSMLRLLADDSDFSRCTSLRLVFAGGEVLTASAVSDFYSVQKAELCNLYGPTEACIDATFWRCPRNIASGPVAIGRPIWNTSLYILDRYNNSVPPGCTGELYIGGVGLALGYLNAPELTAQRFARNPFVEDPDARLYKTGDLVRCRRDGVVEILGRADDQVKIRGFRIELGEVESALASHPSVRECAVVVGGRSNGEVLTAYVAAVEGGPPSSRQLRDYLRRMLPEYAIPTAILPLAALPRMPNGKVDRRALPVPTTSDMAEKASFVRPSTEMEKMLTCIWSEVLELEAIGINDNFFDLGGHSLKAARVISRIRRHTGFSVPLRTRTRASAAARWRR